MPGRRSTVRLNGGPPWGFRLAQGPGDLAILTIAKVRPKSKAYNILREGDILLCLNGVPAEDLNYDQAMDIMDSDINDLTLDISRDGFEDENVGPAQSVIPMADKFDAKERSDETSSLEESEAEEIEVSSEPRDISQAAHQGAEPINPGIQENQLEEKINSNIETKPPNELLPIQSKDSDEPKQTPLNVPVTQDETSQATTDIVERPEATSVEVHETEDHSADLKQEEEEESEEEPEGQTAEEPQTKEPDRVVTLEPINLSEPKHVEEVQGGAAAPGTTNVLTAKDIRSLPTFNRIIRGFSAPQPQHEIKREIPSQQQQTIPVLENRPGVGRSPSSGFVTARNVFQSQEIGQSILGDGGARGVHFQQHLPVGGDGGLSGSSAQDFSRKFQQFEGSPHSAMGSTGTMFRVKKFASTSKSEKWTPTAGFATKDYSSSTCQTNTESLNGLASPYSTFSKPRPVSMPPGNYNYESSQTESDTRTTPMEIHVNGRALSEEKKLSSTPSDHHSHEYHRLLKAVQPPPESEQMDFLLSGKKMFSSSSFYEDAHHKYPTVEEQVELCRKIANSLSADTNKLSRGASMYSKRQKRADKWVFEGPDPEDEPNYSSSPDSAKHRNGTEDGSGRRKLKLVLDPRQLQDATKLRNSGLYNEHNVISPDICFDLVKDLNSPTGKGAALFAKRKKKSEKWIVDETTVKQHTVTTTETTSGYAQDGKANAENRPMSASDKLLQQQRLKLIKSPWEAALESPIGSCDAAFQEVRMTGRAGQFAESLVKRAEEYKPPPPPPLTPTESWAHDAYPGSLGRATTPTFARYQSKPDIYKPRAPRGWGGYATDSLSTDTFAQESSFERSAPSPHASIWNLGQFTDFNSKARLWGASSSSGFRPVRPPSLLLTK